MQENITHYTLNISCILEVHLILESYNTMIVLDGACLVLIISFEPSDLNIMLHCV